MTHTDRSSARWVSVFVTLLISWLGLTAARARSGRLVRRRLRRRRPGWRWWWASRLWRRAGRRQLRRRQLRRRQLRGRSRRRGQYLQRWAGRADWRRFRRADGIGRHLRHGHDVPGAGRYQPLGHILLVAARPHERLLAAEHEHGSTKHAHRRLAQRWLVGWWFLRRLFQRRRFLGRRVQHQSRHEHGGRHFRRNVRRRLLRRRQHESPGHDRHVRRRVLRWRQHESPGRRPARSAAA